MLTFAVTWDPSFFPSTTISNTTVRIQGNFPSPLNITSFGNPGFSSPGLSAAQGFYIWSPAFELFGPTSPNSTELDIQLLLAVSSDEHPEKETQLPGPTVHLTNRTLPGGFGVADDSSDSSSGGQTNAAAIAVPIIVILLLIAGLVLCYRSYRKNGRVPIVGRFMASAASRRGRNDAGGLHGLPPPSGQGFGSRDYAAGKFDGSDLGDSRSAGIQLADRERTEREEGGRNVFRDELRRQEDVATF
jgi:hypothetical protein